MLAPSPALLLLHNVLHESLGYRPPVSCTSALWARTRVPYKLVATLRTNTIDIKMGILLSIYQAGGTKQ